jgi:hypothetical protein
MASTEDKEMIQVMLIPETGKKLIGMAVAVHPAVKKALKSGTVVVIAGTTNGYAAEEILKTIGQAEGFSRDGFFRGVTVPRSIPADASGRQAADRTFPGDAIIIKGKLLKGKTIFDVADELKEGDVVIKGANAVNTEQKRAAILIGHPKGGTVIAALQASIGRRVKTIIPVGLEKRVSGSLDELAEKVNAPGARGLRLLPVPGEILTEIEAVSIISGAEAELFAAGGVCGAEGAVWLAVKGTAEEEKKIKKIIGALDKKTDKR